ncbi:MAG TPA: potassium channel family protein [Jiangellaceae bacterium]
MARRRQLVVGLLRALVVATVLVAIYFLVPLDRLATIPLELTLTVGLLVLATVATYQVMAITRSEHPAVRAVEALAAIVPLLLLLFATMYFLMAEADADNFGAETLTRTDSLYFAVTVFTTVGFGDITATSQAARLLVTTQMMLNLLVLGIGIRVLVGAVQIGRQKTTSSTPADADS